MLKILTLKITIFEQDVGNCQSKSTVEKVKEVKKMQGEAP